MSMWAFERLCEPSTWASIAGVLAAVAGLFPELQGALIAGAAGAGAIGVALKEQG